MTEAEVVTGQKLRAARLAAGLTQEELARRIGSQQPAIARLEAGSAGSPSMRTLERIAEALGAVIDWEFVSRDEALTRGVPGVLR